MRLGVPVPLLRHYHPEVAYNQLAVGVQVRGLDPTLADMVRERGRLRVSLQLISAAGAKRDATQGAWGEHSVSATLPLSQNLQQLVLSVQLWPEGGAVSPTASTAGGGGVFSRVLGGFLSGGGAGAPAPGGATPAADPETMVTVGQLALPLAGLSQAADLTEVHPVAATSRGSTMMQRHRRAHPARAGDARRGGAPATTASPLPPQGALCQVEVSLRVRFPLPVAGSGGSRAAILPVRLNPATPAGQEVSLAAGPLIAQGKWPFGPWLAPTGEQA
ncbi:hypothetical protein H696_02029 [Fonticula alba]|uniref:Uncharacterized protein n=1 Tax=Fonticula alba TaxID=691883 RepID=A0A058ZA20_FONAL|nr:hypothetical protein H696_02029 [Fonticula alba]KCV71080.1 hypothetical protein H696_02029 [Fonticula alba]|eukprot:XP_009494203.1 hypothetical protein H696_02029 [Fonticula alba]